MKILGCFVVSSVICAAGAARTEYLNRLPLRFEENQGRYIARAQNFSLSLAPTGNWLEYKNASVYTRLVGADPSTRLEAADRLPGVANYFLGNPGEWRADVTGFGRIRYRQIYAGIDLDLFMARNIGWSMISWWLREPILGRSGLGVERPKSLAHRRWRGSGHRNRCRRDPVEETGDLSDGEGARRLVDGRFRR